jgi:putative aminopeptidase FrvX
MSLQNIILKTQEFLKVPSVVRFEKPFITRLSEEFSLPGYEVDLQEHLLVVSKTGRCGPGILTAHIDRHGLVLNKEGLLEYAAFNAKKHYEMDIKDSENLFKKIGVRFVGEPVYAYNPVSGSQLDAGIVRSFSYDFQNKKLIFEAEGLQKLEPDTPVAFVSNLEQKDGSISSQIDNVISVAVAYQLVKDGFDGRLFFSAEEEIGKSWRHILSYLISHGIKSDTLLILDTTSYDYAPVVDEGMVVLRNKDEHAEFNTGFVARIISLCDFNQITYQLKDKMIDKENLARKEGEKPKKLGTTELGRIIEHGDQLYTGATVQIPTTRYHTNHETATESALNNYYTLLHNLL